MTTIWWRSTLGGALATVLAGVVWLGSYEVPRDAIDPARGGPLIVTDARGEVLRSVPALDGRPGRADWVSLSNIASPAVLTLLVSEDERFFEHSGVDPLAVARALWLNVRASSPLGGSAQLYGASTVTMQLARMIHSQGKPRSLLAKLIEARAAFGLERELGKRAILEQYLNRAYFGHDAYGIEAAAQTYFGKSAKSLSVGEATTLMVLPRNPSLYDPFRHRDTLMARRQHLLALLVKKGRLTRAQADRALAEQVSLHTAPRPFRAPHFVDWVLASAPAETHARGGVLQTTLDVRLQDRLEHRTRDYVATLGNAGPDQAAVVVLDSATGAVLAMVGSSDYRASTVNMATWRRHPGSALKPFFYGLAVEDGAGSGTVAFDVRDVSPNYLVKGAPAERGPVLFREALAGSLNFAAVDVIERVGLERAADRLRLAGVGELPQTGEDYGVRLALGATEVRLVDLAAAYRAFVYDGEVLSPTWDPHRPAVAPTRVFSPETSYIVMDMLSDPAARRGVFGDELPVDLPYRVVAKTGTPRGFSDTFAVIATRELIVAAWVGRMDGRPTQGRLGMDTAAPLARDALLVASRGALLSLPDRPDGIVDVEVCPLSGLRAGPHCAHAKHELFRAGHAPEHDCDWHHADGSVTYPALLDAWRARSETTADRLLVTRR